MPLPRTLVLGALLGSVVLVGVAESVLISRPPSTLGWPRADLLGLHLTLAVSLAVALGGLIAEFRRPIDRRRQTGFLRAGFVLAVAGSAVWFAMALGFKALWLMFTMAVFAGLFGAVVWTGPWLARWVPRRILRPLDLALTNVAVAVVLLELSLRVLASLHPHPVFAVDRDANAVVSRYRFAPGQMHYGFPTDERGFVDPGLTDPPRHPLVAIVGDSFGVGVVPRSRLWIQVAQDALPEAELYNASVVACGPAEFLHLLQDELLGLEPDLVVIASFLGNDILEASRFGRSMPVVDWVFDPKRLMLATLPGRLWAMQEEQENSGSSAALFSEQGTLGAPVGDVAAIEARYPWLDDPSQEEPTMSESTWFRIERRRAEICAVGNRVVYDPAIEAFAAIEAAVGAERLRVVLIPDEFQVDDELWARIEDDCAPQQLERDRPQRLVGGWLEARGIRTLDLLGRLRASEDRLYHLRDTHWNARGNAVAGRALAEFLSGEPLLDRVAEPR